MYNHGVNLTNEILSQNLMIGSESLLLVQPKLFFCSTLGLEYWIMWIYNGTVIEQDSPALS